MAYVPGITKSASVPSGSYNKKSVEQKKEEKHKKKSTCKWEIYSESFFLFHFLYIDDLKTDLVTYLLSVIYSQSFRAPWRGLDALNSSFSL